MKKIICFMSVMLIMFMGLATAALPSVSSVGISSEGGFPDYETEDLEATATESDTDPGDSVKSIHRWTKHERLGPGEELLELIMPFERVDDSDSDNAQDYSTNEDDAAEGGGVSWQSAAGYDGVGCYRFDGDRDDLIFRDNWDAKPQHWTIEFWMKADDVADKRTAIHIYQDSPLGPDYYLGISANGATHCVEAVFKDSGADVTLEEGSCEGEVNDVMDGDWHHIAFVRDTASWKLYVDGDLDDSDTDASVSLDTSMDEMYIGRALPMKGYDDFDGDIDDLRIWSVSLAEAQIELLANGDGNISDEDDDILDSSLVEANHRYLVLITPNDNNDGDGTAWGAYIDIEFGYLSTCKSSDWGAGYTYYMLGDLFYSYPIYCLEINVDDVTIDCGGNKIDCYAGDTAIVFDKVGTIQGGAVKDCEIDDSFNNGVYAENMNELVLEDNYIHALERKVDLFSCYNCEVTGNVLAPTIGTPSDYGIYADYSNNLDVSENLFYYIDFGVYLSNSDDGDYHNNIFGISTTNGIKITSGCDDNDFYNNDFYGPDKNKYVNGTSGAGTNYFTVGGEGNYWKEHYCVDMQFPFGVCDNPFTTSGETTWIDTAPWVYAQN